MTRLKLTAVNLSFISGHMLCAQTRFCRHGLFWYCHNENYTGFLGINFDKLPLKPPLPRLLKGIKSPVLHDVSSRLLPLCQGDRRDLCSI